MSPGTPLHSPCTFPGQVIHTKNLTSTALQYFASKECYKSMYCAVIPSISSLCWRTPVTGWQGWKRRKKGRQRPISTQMQEVTEMQGTFDMVFQAQYEQVAIIWTIRFCFTENVLKLVWKPCPWPKIKSLILQHQGNYIDKNTVQKTL